MADDNRKAGELAATLTNTYTHSARSAAANDQDYSLIRSHIVSLTDVLKILSEDSETKFLQIVQNEYC